MTRSPLPRSLLGGALTVIALCVALHGSRARSHAPAARLTDLPARAQAATARGGPDEIDPPAGEVCLDQIEASHLVDERPAELLVARLQAPRSALLDRPTGAALHGAERPAAAGDGPGTTVEAHWRGGRPGAGRAPRAAARARLSREAWLDRA